MKILFWIDDGHILFGVAKFLQEKYDFPLFAVYDVNHITKNFYEHQNLVHFNKIWFWRENLSSPHHKPDIEYLKKVEEKYDLPLWLLAYSERKFYKFNEFHKFSHDEILSVTEDECKIFEEIFDDVKPDCILMNITDLHRNILFKEIAEARGIPIFMLWPIRFANGCVISKDYDVIDNFDPSTVPNRSDTKEIKHQDFLEKNNPRKGVDAKFINRSIKLGIFKIFERHLKFLLYICNNEYRKFYENWGKTRLRFLISKEFSLTLITKRWYRRRFLDKHTIKIINKNEKFVYFPLGYEPERTILERAPYYTNQIEVLIQVAKSIPIDYKIFVKEHYAMKNEAFREINYYKKIIELPNVKLIHPSSNTKDLLQHCSLVVTVAGTSAIEGAFYKKPSIIFSDASFDYLPFVNRVRSYEDLPEIIRLSLKNEFNYSLLDHYIELTIENSFNLDPMQLMLDVAMELHDYNGLTREVNISESKMKKFLENHKEDFEKLVSQYIKKIESISH